MVVTKRRGERKDNVRGTKLAMRLFCEHGKSAISDCVIGDCVIGKGEEIGKVGQKVSRDDNGR
jgi:hypothetical protein